WCWNDQVRFGYSEYLFLFSLNAWQNCVAKYVACSRGLLRHPWLPHDKCFEYCARSIDLHPDPQKASKTACELYNTPAANGVNDDSKPCAGLFFLCCL